MLQQQVHLITTVLMIIDALCVIGSGYGALFAKVRESGGAWTMSTDVFTFSVLLVMFSNNYMIGRSGLYGDRRPASTAGTMGSIGRAVLVSFGLLGGFIFFFQEKEYSRLFFLFFAACSFLSISLVRAAFQYFLDKVARKDPYTRKILVIGNSERRKFVINLLHQQLSWGHEVIGQLDFQSGDKGDEQGIASGEDLEKIVREKTIDEIVFATGEGRSIPLSSYISVCRKIGLSCRILPAMWQPDDPFLSVESCQGVPFLTLHATSFNATGLLYKRVLDIAGGLIGTFLFLALYPFAALLIKLDSPGPVIFRQKRIGMHGRIFDLFKFRTMHRDAEARLGELAAGNEMKGAMFKIKKDPRITRAGHWLRKSSVDEIPQFWNVLKGDMSLVGTRPPTAQEVGNYKPEHLRRIAAKPGITGLWQVSGRNRIDDFEKVVELDCRYLEKWRFLNDIQILIKTIWVVLKRKGAA